MNEKNLRNEDISRLEEVRKKLNLSPEEAAEIQRETTGGFTLEELQKRQQGPTKQPEKASTSSPTKGEGSQWNWLWAIVAVSLLTWGRGCIADLNKNKKSLPEMMREQRQQNHR